MKRIEIKGLFILSAKGLLGSHPETRPGEGAQR